MVLEGRKGIRINFGLLFEGSQVRASLVCDWLSLNKKIPSLVSLKKTKQKLYPLLLSHFIAATHINTGVCISVKRAHKHKIEGTHPFHLGQRR